jgi:hypothetical protein
MNDEIEQRLIAAGLDRNRTAVTTRCITSTMSAQEIAKFIQPMPESVSSRFAESGKSERAFPRSFPRCSTRRGAIVMTDSRRRAADSHSLKL